jgi:hypothetical protein
VIWSTDYQVWLSHEAVPVLHHQEHSAKVLQPELGTKPRVYYKNLWRYATCFIGGTVSSEQDGVVDCVEGAPVRLSKQGKLIAEAAADNYGDFKFDRLPENSGDYELEIWTGNGAKTLVRANLGAIVYVGEVRL